MFWVWVGVAWFLMLVLVVLFFYGAFRNERELRERRRQAVMRMALLLEEARNQAREGEKS